MKIIQKVLVGVLVLALLIFTAVFVLDAYNTGKIGNKAEKVADTFTQDIIGTWTGEHSISRITFNQDGTTTLTMLGIAINGEYSDSFDLQTQKHTLRVKYKSSLGLSVERFFTAELNEDTLSLIDSQFDSVKMIYKRSSSSDKTQTQDETTKLYNPGIDVYKKELLGEWLSDDVSNSGYEFREDSSVYLKIYGVGYDGTYSISIDPVTNRCVVKINYISVAGVTVSNSYFVTIADDILTLTQKNFENITTTYQKVRR